MEATIKKWGNSAAVRIPAHVLEASKLALDAAVMISVIDGRIVIEPARKPARDLESLLSEITEANQHSSVDFGKTEGNETW